MTTHLQQGAVSCATRRLIFPDIALKSEKYNCPVCESSVIFRKGEKNAPHFAHNKNSNCSYYVGNGGETDLHKEAKIRIQYDAIHKLFIEYFRSCVACGDKLRIPVNYPEIYDVVCEHGYKDEGSRKSADVAIVDKSNPANKFIIEVLNTHKTAETSRSGDWVEFKAEDIVSATPTYQCQREYICGCCVQKRNAEIERRQLVAEAEAKRKRLAAEAEAERKRVETLAAEKRKQEMERQRQEADQKKQREQMRATIQTKYNTVKSRVDKEVRELELDESKLLKEFDVLRKKNSDLEKEVERLNDDNIRLRLLNNQTDNQETINGNNNKIDLNNDEIQSFEPLKINCVKRIQQKQEEIDKTRAKMNTHNETLRAAKNEYTASLDQLQKVLEQEYVVSLDEMDKIALNVARTTMGSLFSLSKSTAFIEWTNERDKK